MSRSQARARLYSKSWRAENCGEANTLRARTDIRDGIFFTTNPISTLPRDKMPPAMGVRNRLRSLFRLFLLFTFLVAVALLSAITTIRLTIHGRQENMPKLVGVSLESAQRITAGLGLELKVEDKIY